MSDEAADFADLSIRQLEERMRTLKDEAAAIRQEMERRRLARRYRHAGRASRLTLAATGRGG